MSSSDLALEQEQPESTWDELKQDTTMMDTTTRSGSSDRAPLELLV